MDYSAQYRHPKWQKRRLERLQKAGYECEDCGSKDNQLHVHHIRYRKGADVWDYADHELACLCDICHKDAHKIRDELLGMFSDCGFSEKKALETINGLSIWDDGFPVRFIYSHGCAVGYAAGRLQCLNVDELLDFSKINPEKIRSFIKDQEQ